MKNQLLVTPTLLDSFEFAKNAPPSWKARAMKDFISMITRARVSYPKWVKEGSKLEDDVYKACRLKQLAGIEFDGSDLFKELVNLCYGGTFQGQLSKVAKVGEHEVYYFGKTDVDFPEITKDIKTTINFRGDHKYETKWQHKLYSWMNNKERFEYIIAVWKGEHDYTLKDVKTIPITLSDRKRLDRDIQLVTLELFEFVRANDLWKDYFFTFSKN